MLKINNQAVIRKMAVRSIRSNRKKKRVLAKHPRHLYLGSCFNSFIHWVDLITQEAMILNLLFFARL